IERYRKAIAASQDTIKAFQSSLRALRGNSDEVKEAKARLKAQIDAEKDAISRSTLALAKHGSTVLDTTKKTKEQTVAVNNAKSAISAAGGPVATLTSKLGSLGEILGGTGGMLGAVTLGAAGLVAAIVSVTSSIVDNTIKL